MLTIHSSPLQGITDFRFRNAFQKYFGGIDQYIAPYIRLNGKTEIKPGNIRDLLPSNNRSLKLIPQIITKDTAEFLFVAKYVQNLGYKELNFNLGCPYPMIAKRGMGSGLLGAPEKIDEILTSVCAETDIFVPDLQLIKKSMCLLLAVQIFTLMHQKNYRAQFLVAVICITPEIR